MNKQLIQEAWKIRKQAAKLYACRVSDILWKGCISMAKDYLNYGSAINYFENTSSIKEISNNSWEQIVLEYADEKITLSEVTHVGYKWTSPEEKQKVKKGGYIAHYNDVEYYFPTLKKCTQYFDLLFA